MKKTITLLALLSFLVFSCTTDRDIMDTTVVIDPTSDLIHYWNFNTITGTQTLVNPDVTLLPLSGASISYPGSGAGYMDTFTPGYDSNLQNTEDAGSGLRARNPSATRNLVMAVPTTGYKTIVVQFATATTSSGAQTQK